MDQNKPNENPIHELTQLRLQYAELKTAYEKNIAGQKQTNESLRQSEHKFFVLFEKSAVPATLSKLTEGTIVDVNEAFEHEFELTKQEVLGKTSFELGINPDAEVREQIYKSINEVGSVHNQEIVLLSKLGEKNYYEANIEKVFIDGEEFLLNTVQNISKYKRAENKLKENYNLIRIAGEKAKLGGWNVILKENRAYWSDEVAAIHEMPAGYSLPVEDAIHFYAPEWRDKMTEAFSRCAQEGIPYDDEMEIITAGGKRIWVQTMGEAVRDENGNIVKVQGAFQDITKRKKAEAELIKAKSTIGKSEIRYRTVVSNSPVVTFVLNPAGIFTLSEGKGLEKLGLKSGQVVGLSAFDVYKDYPLIIDNIKEALTGNNSRSETVLPGVVFEVFYTPVFDKKGNLVEVIGVANDITERKQAVEELLKSKNSLEEYFENDISADYVVSVSGEIFSCNKTFLNLFGFEKKSETKKFDITELYKNPEDRKQIIRLVKKQGKVENHEVEFISKEGKNIYAIINAIGIFGKDDKLEKIRGYVVDISEQKNIEKELQKSEEKYRLMFYNNPQPMWIYGLETLAFLEVNQAAVNHYGYSKEEFLSMTLKDIRPAEDIPVLLEEFAKTRSNLKESGAWRHLKKNGEIIDVEIASHSVLFNDRNARHILIKDITERKFFETELLKLSRAVEQSPASVIITDINGNIEYVNPKATEITGYTKEELIGKNPRILSSGGKPKSEYQQLWNTITSAKEWFGEFHNKKKNGELYWESASISPIINEKQKIINYVAIKENITEQKKFIEDLKIAKAKAEESDRLKSAFLANMSHEIRTPMNGILGFTELLLEPDLSSEQKEAYINIVNQSGQRMLNTVNDIVEISKIEAGIITVDLKEVDVQVRLDELIRFFIPEVTKKGLRLILENEVPKTVALISTDQNKIDSILTNLIKNAIKYTPAGEIRVGCNVHEKMLEFYVKDSGIGIPAERQQAVFERFIKADILDKDARQGSGLGLAITKAYVEMLGGAIRVESIINQGSTFYFTLPLTFDFMDVNKKITFFPK